MKLRDALDAFVPKWSELEAKTSREFVVVAALCAAKVREPKTELAERFLAWAVARFGNPDPCAGAVAHAIEADWNRMPYPFRALIQSVGRGEATMDDVIAWRGPGDDHPLVQLVQKRSLDTVLARIGVGGAS
jgi:hypothetical protein